MVPGMGLLVEPPVWFAGGGGPMDDDGPNCCIPVIKGEEEPGGWEVKLPGPGGLIGDCIPPEPIRCDFQMINKPR